MNVRRNTVAFYQGECARLTNELAESRQECHQLRTTCAQWAFQAKLDASKITRLKAQLTGQYRDPQRPVTPARQLMDKCREFAARHGVSTRVVDGEIQAYDSENRTWNVVEITD